MPTRASTRKRAAKVPPTEVPPKKASKTKIPAQPAKTPAPKKSSKSTPPADVTGRVTNLEIRLGGLETSVKDGNDKIMDRLDKMLPISKTPAPLEEDNPVIVSVRQFANRAAAGTVPAAPSTDVTDTANNVNSTQQAAHVARPTVNTPIIAPFAHPDADKHHQPIRVPTQPTTTPADNVYSLFSGSVAPPNVLPTCFAEANDHVLGERVQVLINSASQLSTLKGRRTMPYEYIVRGPDRVKTGINTLSEMEYLFGLFCMIYDPKTPNDQKPHLSKHLYHIVEDGAVFKWDQVRQWSEELFAKIADSRITWDDILDLHSLRNTMSKAAAGRIHHGPHVINVPPRQGGNPFKPNPSTRGAHAAPTQQAYAASTAVPPPGVNQQSQSRQPKPKPDMSRPDVPCRLFNMTVGCNRPDGHNESGQQFGHHCAWCRANLHRIHYHSEVVCRIRADPYNNNPTFQA